MINLKYLVSALETTNGNEFKCLFIIANTLSLKNESRTRIYREMLCDKMNLTPKQITRLTNSLEEKGLIKKDIVSNGVRKVTYYSLCTDKNVHENGRLSDKNVPFNNKKKEEKKEKEIIKEIKDKNGENGNIPNVVFVEVFEDNENNINIPSNEIISKEIALTSSNEIISQGEESKEIETTSSNEIESQGVESKEIEQSSSNRIESQVDESKEIEFIPNNNKESQGEQSKEINDNSDFSSKKILMKTIDFYAWKFRRAKNLEEINKADEWFQKFMQEEGNNFVSKLNDEALQEVDSYYKEIFDEKKMKAYQLKYVL